MGGLPINPSGRHSGCRPTMAADGTLLVGTGDTARGTLPQDRGSLGGKVLRVDLATGGPAPRQPVPGRHRSLSGLRAPQRAGRRDPARHRAGVVGRARPDRRRRGEPARRPGANYGWDPAQGGTVGGYDESVPMTDLERFPDARPAAWSSGRPVEAVSGALVPARGGERRELAVAALRGQKLLLMTVGATARWPTCAIPRAAGRHVRPAAGGAHRAGRGAAGVDVQRRRRQGAAGRPA